MIRVLRVLEYVYDSGEVMADDMKKWGVHGVIQKRGYTISSAVVSTEHFKIDPLTHVCVSEAEGFIQQLASELKDEKISHTDAANAIIEHAEGRT